MLLAGIVAAQVEILKLGATMGRALEQTTALSGQNEQLRGSVAVLSDDQRIERLAANMGMVLPPPGAVGYLAGKPDREQGRALGNLHSPDAAAFVLLPARNGALVTGPGTSTLPPAPGAPPPPPAATTTTATTTPTSATATANTTAATATPTATTAATPTATTTATTTPTTTSTQTVATTPTAAPAQTTTSQASTVPPTGAAAIQPSTSSQTTSGG